MTQEDDFLRAVAADPADRATRLVFTDWLLERGDERAEFVRLDTDLRAMTGDEPAFAAMEERWREWRARLPRLWLGAFGHLFTSEELRREAARAETFTLVAGPLRSVAVTRELHFRPEDYQVPVGVGHLSIVWGRRDVMSGLRFWLETGHVDLWWPPDAEATYVLCALTEATWRRAIAGALSRLRSPPPSPCPGKGAFLAAVSVMLAEGPDWGLLAAYEEEYIAAVWHTTA